jgi:hypothetical protein
MGVNKYTTRDIKKLIPDYLPTHKLDRDNITRRYIIVKDYNKISKMFSTINASGKQTMDASYAITSEEPDRLEHLVNVMDIKIDSIDPITNHLGLMYKIDYKPNPANVKESLTVTTEIIPWYYEGLYLANLVNDKNNNKPSIDERYTFAHSDKTVVQDEITRMYSLLKHKLIDQLVDLGALLDKRDSI